MKNKKNVLFALGLAQKAGKLASGDTAVQYAVKAGKAFVIILAEDASENSRKDIINMGKNYDTPVLTGLTKAELGQAIGKAQRTAIAVLDINFHKMISKEF